ncbi:M16 family metallopeptidase [Vampirovibrio chlorellavorus]|uniref:M16 family metallopeptidase n=1 Tax=Vampirovibrio chlorellavorus TaxID=758823 RepID=UPI0026EAAF57|nr:pitrilysin family protein [Vampirovibrio chlorellavorus]
MLKVEALPTEILKLSTGATLLHTPIETAPRLAISMFLPGGNLLDAVPGVSDMVDRLLLKGTTTRNQEQISIELDGLTLEVDTDTKRDYSAIHATLLEEDLDTSFELIADFFYNATFSEFEREKQKVAGEVMMDLDSPKSRASDQFIRKLFENTPYGIVSSVILDALPSLNSVADLKAHYQRVFTPQNLIVSVAGNISADKMAKALEKSFPSGAPNAPVVEDSVQARLRNLTLTQDELITFARDDSSQAHIFKGWLVPEAKHDDYAPLALMNTILGAAGLSSRLFLELRDKQGLAYNVRSTYEAYRHKGLFYLYIGTEPKNKDKCLKGFIEEVNKLADIPVSAEELADAKRNILGRRSVFLETAHQQANYIGANFTQGRSLEEIARVPEQIEAVTPADVQRVVRQYLLQPALVSLVGPSRIF